MPSTSEIPVTDLSVRAYTAIFNSVPITLDEVIVDIGSGESRLGDVVPDGSMIQVDPIYGSVEDFGNTSFVKLGLGKPETPNTRAFRDLLGLEATRVTTAHMLHHLSGERKLLVVEQILQLARFGIAQFYPAKAGRVAELVESAEKRGVDLSITRPPIRNFGQAFFTFTGINHTLNIVSQLDRMTPRDRSKLAKLIIPAIV